MALLLIPLEQHTTLLAVNYMPHLLLLFAFYWIGNRI